MFVSAKPLAALSSGLLARKGQARPAMRPQAFAAPSAAALEDLGWNDMGPAAALPPVLTERAALADGMEQPPVPEAAVPEPAAAGEVTIAVVGPALPGPRDAARGKAAFTLRLDSHRHLRLRLASAVTRRSSQALLVHALDAYLHTLPEVEELARQCSRPEPLGEAR